jgi:hypothetical protein
MALSMAMEISVGEMHNQPTKLPAMKTSMETTVKSITSDGDIVYEIVMREGSVSDETGVASQVAETMKAASAASRG